MTITLYSGTPGSGKSLHATKAIRDSLNYKKPVVANYNLNCEVKGFDCFSYCPNDALTPQYLKDYAISYWSEGGRKFKEDHILLVIDECQLIFNSREWQAKNRAEWLEFFSQHRKFGYEIIFIAQFDRMIDRQIRSLIEYEVIHRRLGNFGLRGKIMTLFAFGEIFVAVKRFYPLNERIGVSMFRVRKSIYRMYDSYAAFRRDPQGVGGSPAAASDAP